MKTIITISQNLVAHPKDDAKVVFPILGVDERGEYVLATSAGAQPMPDGYNVIVREWTKTLANQALPVLTGVIRGNGIAGINGTLRRGAPCSLAYVESPNGKLVEEHHLSVEGRVIENQPVKQGDDLSEYVL